MDISVVSSQVLTERLDAEFYRPAFLKNADCLEHLGNCINLGKAANYIKLGYTGPTEKYYSPQGAFYLSSKNIVDGVIVIDEQTDKISLEAHKSALKATSIQCGDLLISRTGNVGKCAILYDSEQYYNIAAHLIAIRLNKDLDKEYVAIFFNTRFGQLQTCRIQRGTIIHGLSIHDLPNLLIPKFSYEVQVYIGDKVRQAERLRDRSRELGKIVDGQLIEAGILVTTEFSRTSRISPTLMFNRLDHLHYRTDLLINYQAIQKYPTAKFGDKKYFDNLYDGDHGNPIYGNGPTYIRASELNGHRLNESESACLDKKYAKSISKTRWAHEGDIVFSIVGTLGLISVLRSGQKGIMSRGVAKITSLSLPTYYVKAFMRTAAFGKELLRQSVGTVQRGVYLEALGNIPIPIIEDSVMDSIARMEEESDTSAYLSEWLTNAAKFLVEALIEGNLSEADLKAAQEGLEKGDTTLDREILDRLTRKGIDFPNEPPLFPDLDALYAALASLDATETTETANPPQNRVSNVYHLHSTPLALASEAHDTAYKVTAEVPE
jgi:type I restriction enzyme, S subunit